MFDTDKSGVTRRGFLKTGALVAATPLLADAPFAAAQSAAKNVTKVHDFQTSADVAKAEQEGEVVYYGHDSEQGIAYPSSPTHGCHFLRNRRRGDGAGLGLLREGVEIGEICSLISEGVAQAPFVKSAPSSHCAPPGGTVSSESPG